MKLHTLMISDNESLANEFKKVGTFQEINLEILCHADITKDKFFCYDVICIIGEEFENVIKSLSKIRSYNPYSSIAVFLNTVTEEIVLRALEQGADVVSFNEKDIILKHFERIGKRSGYYLCPLCIGDLVFDPSSQSISQKSKIVNLNLFETRLMKLLLQNVGDVIPFSMVSRCMNDGEFSNVKDYTKVYIRRLRKVLEHLGCENLRIENHYGVGYSLVPVEIDLNQNLDVAS